MHGIESANRANSATVERTALCMGGSGFRAALFHVGALRRWNELGILTRLHSIHVVGGGGLVAGMLVARWHKLGRGLDGRLMEIEANVFRPVERFIRRRRQFQPTIMSHLRPRNWKKLASGRFNATDRFVEILDEQLFAGRLLVELSPVAPECTWHSTNLKTGGRWELSRVHVGERMIGFRHPGRTRLSEAVAGCMISPATMQPVSLHSRPNTFEDGEALAHGQALRETALLVDGGIHDPLAIESAIGNATMVLVSDGGAGLSPEPAFDDWLANRLYRSMEIQMHRAVEVRRRWLVEMIRSGRIEGTYASLAADHRDYGLTNSTGYSHSVIEQIGRMPCELNTFSAASLALVVNHGYSIADAAANRLLSHRLDKRSPFRLPYPDVVADSHETRRMDSARSTMLKRAA